MPATPNWSSAITVWSAAATATVISAVLLTLHPSFALYALSGTAGAVLLTWGIWRAPYAAAAVLLIFLQLQAALKFYVSPAFGPIKDAATLVLIVLGICQVK